MASARRGRKLTSQERDDAALFAVAVDRARIPEEFEGRSGYRTKAIAYLDEPRGEVFYPAFAAKTGGNPSWRKKPGALSAPKIGIQNYEEFADLLKDAEDEENKALVGSLKGRRKTLDQKLDAAQQYRLKTTPSKDKSLQGVLERYMKQTEGAVGEAKADAAEAKAASVQVQQEVEETKEDVASLKAQLAAEKRKAAEQEIRLRRLEAALLAGQAAPSAKPAPAKGQRRFVNGVSGDVYFANAPRSEWNYEG